MRRLVAVLLVALSLVACGGDDGEEAVAQEVTPSGAVDVLYGGGLTIVDVEDLGSSGGKEPITVLDVRTPEEFAAGHLEGAVNLDVQSASFDDLVRELPKEATYLVYCRSGDRSVAATERMLDAGLTNVITVVDGGFDDLVAAGARAA